ncbi:TPA: ATP-dependent protease subunit HslV [Candidatus Poribacteria bacterium]|nr:ATP-dependent protease subunit HslV [Candidatus Poribacteria bacterium]HIO07989.1 ATP-dependent protease subunit HslV [Candidatus Poribacteria bacterium]
MIKSTTIITVRRNGGVAIGGDGQVTLGDTIIKHGAKKIRKIYDDRVLIGFAGSASDGLTLYEMLENKLEQHRHLQRAAHELAKEWRTDRILRRMEALMIAADADTSYLISGNGDLIMPDDGVLAIGAGGDIALASARSLIQHSELSAVEIVSESLKIASEICIYTNNQIEIEKLTK